MKYFSLLLIIFFCACNTNSKTREKAKDDSVVVKADATQKNTTNSDSLVLSTSRQVLALLKNKAFIRLSAHFHPVEGVRFSPYGFVDTTSHKILQAGEFLQAIEKKQTIYWGAYDGTGDSILLTAAQYYNKFIYNADFLNAEKYSINKRLSKGNSLDNITSVYPGCNYTEHYFPGFDKKYGGMDWTTLKLVFKFHNGRNYLVGMVHDQWTI
jgi:hypothetical protein